MQHAVLTLIPKLKIEFPTILVLPKVDGSFLTGLVGLPRASKIRANISLRRCACSDPLIQPLSALKETNRIIEDLLTYISCIRCRSKAFKSSLSSVIFCRNVPPSSLSAVGRGKCGSSACACLQVIQLVIAIYRWLSTYWLCVDTSLISDVRCLGRPRCISI